MLSTAVFLVVSVLPAYQKWLEIVYIYFILVWYVGGRRNSYGYTHSIFLVYPLVNKQAFVEDMLNVSGDLGDMD